MAEDRNTSPGVRKDSFLLTLPAQLRTFFCRAIEEGNAQLIHDPSTGEERLRFFDADHTHGVEFRAARRGLVVVRKF